jgi:hypothetical protein
MTPIPPWNCTTGGGGGGGFWANAGPVRTDPRFSHDPPGLTTVPTRIPRTIGTIPKLNKTADRGFLACIAVAGIIILDRCK